MPNPHCNLPEVQHPDSISNHTLAGYFSAPEESPFQRHQIQANSAENPAKQTIQHDLFVQVSVAGTMNSFRDCNRVATKDRDYFLFKKKKKHKR